MENPRVSLGPFEVDFHTGEVRKHGLLVKLQDKPLRVLQLLIERHGELVSREELRQHLWPQDLYLDFDRNLTIAMNKLRSALNDSAEKPRYIETLPRRGYRLIAHVQKSNGNGSHPGNGRVTAIATVAALNIPSEIPASVPRVTAAPPSPALSVENSPARSRGAWLRWAAGFIVAALIALEAFLHPAWFSTSGNVDFHERDWVLISRFENRTGEPVLDGTVEYALARELSNSSFVGLAPAERVQDVLRMMKRPGDTPLDASTAREVCLRDGGIRAVINGRVEKLGAIYVLSASVVIPASDTQVAGVSAEAHDPDGILPAVHQLSNRLRETLGEKLPAIRQSNAKLEPATTPSLRALQLYSQGMSALFSGQDRQAIPFFEEALREDPQFASAHVYLGHCYSNLGMSKQAEPHFREAFDLANTTSDRERYFILGSYYQQTDVGREKAIQAYEVLLRLHPDDYWGANNLAFEYRQAGRFQESMSMIARLAEMRPNNPAINYQVANRLFRTSVDIDRVRPFIQRAMGISTEEMIKLDPEGVTMMETFPAFDFYEQGNLEKVLAELARIQKEDRSLGENIEQDIQIYLAFSYFSLGRLHQAEQIFQKLHQPGARNDALAMLAVTRNDGSSLASHTQLLVGDNDDLDTTMPPILQARAGFLDLARKGIAIRQSHQPYSPGFLEAMQAEVLLASGQPSKAIPLLRKAVVQLAGTHKRTYYLALESLATALEQEGQLADAVQVLDTATQADSGKVLDTAYEWMRIEWKLAQLHRKVQQPEVAQKIEAELRKRLAYADPDHPILLQLNRL